MYEQLKPLQCDWCSVGVELGVDVSKHQYGDSFRNKISLYLQENPDLRWKVRMLALAIVSKPLRLRDYASH